MSVKLVNNSINIAPPAAELNPVQENNLEQNQAAAAAAKVADIGAAIIENAPARQEEDLLAALSSPDFLKNRILAKNNGLVEAVAKIKIDDSNVRGLNLSQMKTNLEALKKGMLELNLNVYEQPMIEQLLDQTIYTVKSWKEHLEKSGELPVEQPLARKFPSAPQANIVASPFAQDQKKQERSKAILKSSSAIYEELKKYIEIEKKTIVDPNLDANKIGILNSLNRLAGIKLDNPELEEKADFIKLYDEIDTFIKSIERHFKEISSEDLIPLKTLRNKLINKNIERARPRFEKLAEILGGEFKLIDRDCFKITFSDSACKKIEDSIKKTIKMAESFTGITDLSPSFFGTCSKAKLAVLNLKAEKKFWNVTLADAQLLEIQCLPNGNFTFNGEYSILGLKGSFSENYSEKKLTEIFSPESVVATPVVASAEITEVQPNEEPQPVVATPVVTSAAITEVQPNKEPQPVVATPVVASAEITEVQPNEEPQPVAPTLVESPRTRRKAFKGQVRLAAGELWGKIKKKLFKSVASPNGLSERELLERLAQGNITHLNIGRKKKDAEGQVRFLVESKSDLSLERKMIRGAETLAAFKFNNVKGIDLTAARTNLESLRAQMYENAATQIGADRIWEEMTRAINTLGRERPPSLASRIVTHGARLVGDYAVAPVISTVCSVAKATWANRWKIAATAAGAALISLI